MTDREKRMIEVYLPHPWDESLEPFQYYVRDSACRVHRVAIRETYPGADGAMYHIVYEVGTWKRIRSVNGDPDGGFQTSEIYDNRQDCKDRTHDVYDDWPRLRRLQQKEAEG